MSKRISKKFRKDLFMSSLALEEWINLKSRIIESQESYFLPILDDCDRLISNLAFLVKRLSSRNLNPELNGIDELIKYDETLMAELYILAVSVLHKLNLVILPSADNTPENIYSVASTIEEALNKLCEAEEKIEEEVSRSAC